MCLIYIPLINQYWDTCFQKNVHINVHWIDSGVIVVSFDVISLFKNSQIPGSVSIPVVLLMADTISMEAFGHLTLVSSDLKPKPGRFVDGTFNIWSHGYDNLSALRNHLHSQNYDTKFSKDIESNDSPISRCTCHSFSR